METVDGETPSVVRFDVPAEVRFLHLLRVSVATAAMELEPGMERLDDLRLAVDELATAVIRGAPAHARLAITVELEPRLVAVRGRCPAQGETPTLSEVGGMLLSTVCCEHRLDREGAEFVFSMSMTMD